MIVDRPKMIRLQDKMRAAGLKVTIRKARGGGNDYQVLKGERLVCYGWTAGTASETFLVAYEDARSVIKL